MSNHRPDTKKRRNYEREMLLAISAEHETTGQPLKEICARVAKERDLDSEKLYRTIRNFRSNTPQMDPTMSHSIMKAFDEGRTIKFGWLEIGGKGVMP